MVELFENDIRFQDYPSSRGNQLKFERNDLWYKTDYLGYEGLAEYTVSELLRFSDLKMTEYVSYDLEQIRCHDTVFNGCKSRDFTGKFNLITLERLFQNAYGQSLNKIIYSTEDHIDRLRILTEQVERITGLTNFGSYMSKLLTIDALFLNEDRHTHNMAIMTDLKGTFRLAPIFDNGACLLSDTRIEYPLSGDVFQQIGRVKPKTFCDSFDEQLEIAEKLYGLHIRFHFSYEDVKEIVDKAKNYTEDTRSRVIEIIMQMRRKYAYLFD